VGNDGSLGQKRSRQSGLPRAASAFVAGRDAAQGEIKIVEAGDFAVAEFDEAMISDCWAKHPTAYPPRRIGSPGRSSALCSGVSIHFAQVTACQD
jgi:hypothetical protein